MARILNDVDSDTATPTREQISSLITYRADDTNLQRTAGFQRSSDEIVSGDVIDLGGSSQESIQAEQKAYEDARKKEEEARKAQQAAAESERFGDPNSKVNNGDTNNVTTPPSGSTVTTPPSGSTVTTPTSGSTVTTDGTGQTTTKTDTTDTNPNNQTDSNKKEEAKPKANESPEAAPNKVDESAAMTEEKSIDLSKQNAKQGDSIRVSQGSWYNPTPNPSAKPGGVWAYRKVESNKLSGPPNEFNQQSGPIVAEVKYYFGANWNTLLNGLGSNKPSKQNLIDIPIIMNFPEVGVFNKACPYVAEENTELHMMITKVGNKGGYTYGATEVASWADKDYWCGHWTAWCESKSGYDGGNNAGAGTANVIGWKKCVANFANGKGTKSFAGFPATNINGQNGVYNNYTSLGWDGRKSSTHFSTGYNITIPTKTITETVPDVDKKGKQKIDKKTGKPLFKTVTKEVEDTSKPKPNHWEQLMSDPIQAIFFVGYHIDKSGGLTAAGKRLCSHFVKECNTECFTLSRGDHVEFGIFLNPDGTLISFGGNTSGALSRNGTNFVVRVGTVGKFGLSNGMTVLTAMKGSGQKVSNKLNSKFIRTPLYNAYSNQVGKDNKLSSAYKQIMDKITV